MGKRGKKWSRKRKVEECASKTNKERKDYPGGANDGYNVVKMSNAKFEAYYSYVGLHDSRYDAESGRFVQCVSDAEKHAERDLFMSTLSELLPASFRVDRSLDSMIQRKILDEVQEFIGKEMELDIELPRTSLPTGGRREILERVDASDSNSKPNGGTDARNDDDYDDNGEKEGCGPIIVRRTIAPAKAIPFISSNDTILGYQLSVDKRTLRRNKSLEKFHTWLKIQTDCGHITRQETVSMIPPVVLGAKEGMSVLDMCAAPGSKTCQLLEIVGGLPNFIQQDRDSESLEPSGYVVANDADPKRAYMLVTQLRRMNSPSVFVTSCDGQFFPILDEKSVRGTEREGMFDRVLCDVPCSGDGTIRKNPGIWKHWNQLGSLALHPLQLSIALRSVRVTKVGGYIVYSTCSMNPMENESVVAELLRIADGSLVLEDPRNKMEGLVARPGWSTWKVLRESKNRTRKGMKEWKKKNNPKMQERRKEAEEKRLNGECPPPIESEAKANENRKDGEEDVENYARSKYETIPYIPPATWDNDALSERTKSLGFVEYASFDEVEPEWSKRVRASCFPPTEEEARKFDLHKCLRCLPQDMNTGGFFVALLKKVKPLSKSATERMNFLAKESRGTLEADAHLCKEGGVEDEEKKSDNGEVVFTESSAPKANNISATIFAKDLGVKNEEDLRAPNGKANKQHNKNKKKNDLGMEDFIPADLSIWPPLVEEYGLGPTFPKDQFMVRASGEAKILYFISKSVKKDLIDRGVQHRVTVINSGLKGFERCSIQSTNVTYRVAQEGVQYVVPHMTKRILSANMDDFHSCVKEGLIPFDKFSESFQKGLDELTPGSFIVTLEGYEKDIAKKMYLVMFRRAKKMVDCFVTKVEKEAILSKMRALGYLVPEVEKLSGDNSEQVVENGES
ncbi:hypothetical protein ACHAXA_002858 [Cyclostephanos tholiformis]|uniref:SAM-dependent MTase RsmB/NOP-type domain-containing protein n=1 Tax=Cyclostephanos tholiformis TaxID=382380 RepID=A0ABD3SBP7_9STRA